MLPIPPSALGAGFSTAARILRGDVDVDDDTRERVQRARARLERYAELVGDFSVDSPGSWARTAGRFLDWTFDTYGDAANAAEWREARGFTVSVGATRPVADFVADRAAVPSETAYREEGQRLELVRAPSGVPLVVQFDDGRGPERGLGGAEIYRRQDLSDRRADRAVAACVWANRGALRVDADGTETLLRATDLSDAVYCGENLELLDDWRTFLERGESRNVLLQGDPGTGKTTFCRHAARELASRALLMDGAVFGTVGVNGLARLLERLEPDVVVIDDLDRSGESVGFNGAENLRLLAEARDEVPLLLMTSNDHTELPPALRRPGRIDRIVDFGALDRPDCLRIVRSIAADEEVELPDGREAWLADMLAEHSPAHVREALRRARVLGWEAVPADETTFRMHRDHVDGSAWIRDRGFEPWRVEHPALVDELFDLGAVECAFRGERSTLERLELANGVEICRDDDSGERRYGEYWVRDPEDRGDLGERLADGAAELFWRDRDAVVVSVVERELTVREASTASESYVGPHSRAIDRWRQFLDAGRRRCALLKGPPGTGKTTLAREAARRVGSRAMFVTSDLFDTVSDTGWQGIVELLSPDVAVVDDIDRVGSRALDGKLRLLEERHCEVPLMLLTCNDATKLPDAMKRPGRVDEILEFDLPDPDTRRRLVDDLAERVGVDIPERYYDPLDEVFCDRSPAHVRELLRRADVLGWERVEPLDDARGDGDGDDSAEPRAASNPDATVDASHWVEEAGV